MKPMNPSIFDKNEAYGEYLFVLNIRSKYISLSGHQMQYFDEWRSYE
jgi:hypothetical protein